MGDLTEFARRIELQLADANREPHWKSGEAERYMAEVAARREQYERLADQLIGTVIRPRLEMLAGHFPNASMGKNEPTGHCSWWFGFCERFPTSTKVELVVDHDVRIEHIAVRFEVDMVPLFIKFDQHDKLSMPLGTASEDTVADWVEQRILEFLDAYLRIDRGGEDFEQDTVVDPVCGMRIARAATYNTNHKGHPYYFCSEACQSTFVHDPAAYARFKTL